MRYLLIVLLFISAPAWADTYTFTTTTRQERALNFIIDQQPLVGDPPVRITNKAHLRGLLEQLLENYVTQYKESQALSAQALKDRYDTATPEIRAQIDTLLSTTP